MLLRMVSRCGNTNYMWQDIHGQIHNTEKKLASWWHTCVTCRTTAAFFNQQQRCYSTKQSEVDQASFVSVCETLFNVILNGDVCYLLQ